MGAGATCSVGITSTTWNEPCLQTDVGVGAAAAHGAAQEAEARPHGENPSRSIALE